MAGFELTRIGPVGDIAREWRAARMVPLYLAGIAVGVAAGVAVSIQTGEGAAKPLHLPAASAPVVAPVEPAWQLAPSFSPGVIVVDDAATHVVIPESMLLPVAIPVIEPPAAIAVPADVPAAAVPSPANPPAQTAPMSAPAAAAPVPVTEAAPAPVPPAAPPVAKADFYVPAVPGGGATNLEQRLLDGMNAERAKAGLPPFIYDAGLTKVARTRSQQMADQGYFAHVDPFGYSMYTALLKHFGYATYAWAGENLAMNNYGAAEASERSLVTLMNSPTHRANILATDFFRVGVGEVTTADGRHIFAMIFVG